MSYFLYIGQQPQKSLKNQTNCDKHFLISCEQRYHQRPPDGSNQKPDICVTVNFFRVVSAHCCECKQQIGVNIVVLEQIKTGQGIRSFASVWSSPRAMLSLRFSALSFRSLPALRCLSAGSTTAARYIQGQSPEPRVREYFYYLDHHGQVRNWENWEKQNHHWSSAAPDAAVCSTCSSSSMTPK